MTKKKRACIIDMFTFTIMAYSIVGILAIMVHFVVNLDLIFKRKTKLFTGEMQYFLFLISVILYHVTDACWGFLYDAKSTQGTFIDTTAYFVCMATSILFWGGFVYYYLGQKNKITFALFVFSIVIFGLQIIAIIINFFYPILFQVTEDCVYSAMPMRYGTLGAQILAFLLTSAYTFYVAFHSTGSKKLRHFTVGGFGLAMIVAISLQVAFPLLPMYSIGYVLGVCLLHTFVVQDEKNEQKRQLDEANIRANIDALTGVYSKHAYVDIEAQIDGKIGRKEMTPFAIAMFDLNNLKYINDSLGHDVGDVYIVNATKTIASVFTKSPIYRVGGDEFVAILEGEDYDNREDLLASFNSIIDLNAKKNGVTVSSGIAVFDPEIDNTFIQVFARADSAMYLRKRTLKGIQ